MASFDYDSPDHAPSPMLDRVAPKYEALEDAIEDLAIRFVLNLPDVEMRTKERFCFQVEEALWYYEDFIREQNPSFPSFQFKPFLDRLFAACPLLSQYGHEPGGMYDYFLRYKARIPVCGAILLNETLDKCILVKGWKNSSGWGFPRGKINQAEPDSQCAAREVLEETGYDMSKNIIEPPLRVNNFVNTPGTPREIQVVTLYVVPGVPENFAFATRTRKEISKIEWFKLSDLPGWKAVKSQGDDQYNGKRGRGPAGGKFFLVDRFMPHLKKWIQNYRRSIKRVNGRVHRKSPNPLDEFSENVDDMTLSTAQPDNIGGFSPAPFIVHADATDSLDQPMTRVLAMLTRASVSQGSEVSMSSDTTLTPRPPTSNQEHSPASLLSTSGSSSQALSDEPSPQFSAQRNHDRPPPINTGIPPSSHVRGSHVPLTPASTTSSSASASATTASTTSSVPPRSSASRQSSRIDISPYLPRNTEIPTSGKHLKHFALLEQVSEEAARATPAPTLGPNGLNRGAPVRGIIHPGPSASVPPPFSAPMGSKDWTNAPPMLSSRGPMGGAGPYPPSMVAPQTVPVPFARPSLPSGLLGDSFQVRLRPMPPARGPLSPARSMHEGQLLAILSGDRDTLPPPGMNSAVSFHPAMRHMSSGPLPARHHPQPPVPHALPAFHPPHIDRVGAMPPHMLSGGPVPFGHSAGPYRGPPPFPPTGPQAPAGALPPLGPSGLLSGLGAGPPPPPPLAPYRAPNATSLLSILNSPAPSSLLSGGAR